MSDAEFIPAVVPTQAYRDKLVELWPGCDEVRNRSTRHEAELDSSSLQGNGGQQAPVARRGAEESGERFQAVCNAELGFLFSRRLGGGGGEKKEGGHLFEEGSRPMSVDSYASWAAINGSPGMDKIIAEFTAGWSGVESSRGSDKYPKLRTSLIQQLLVGKLIKRDMRLCYKEMFGTALAAVQGVLSQHFTPSASAVNSNAPGYPVSAMLSDATDEGHSFQSIGEEGGVHLLSFLCRLPPTVEFWVLGAFATRPKGVHAPVVTTIDICSAVHLWKCRTLSGLDGTTSPAGSGGGDIDILALLLAPQFVLLSTLATILCPPQVQKWFKAFSVGGTDLQFGGGGQGHHRSIYAWDAFLLQLARMRCVLGGSVDGGPKANAAVPIPLLEEYLDRGVVECIRRRDHPLTSCKNALFRTREEFLIRETSAAADGAVAGLQLPPKFGEGVSAVDSELAIDEDPSHAEKAEWRQVCETGCRVLAEWVNQCCCPTQPEGGDTAPSRAAGRRVYNWLASCARGEGGGDASLNACWEFAGANLLEGCFASDGRGPPLLPLIGLIGFYSSAGPLETTTLIGGRQHRQTNNLSM